MNTRSSWRSISIARAPGTVPGHAWLALGVIVAVWLAGLGRSVAIFGYALVAFGMVLVSTDLSDAPGYHGEMSVPAFFTYGTYADFIEPGETVLAVPPALGDDGVWQAETGMAFRLARAYTGPIHLSTDPLPEKSVGCSPEETVRCRPSARSPGSSMPATSRGDHHRAGPESVDDLLRATLGTEPEVVVDGSRCGRARRAADDGRLTAKGRTKRFRYARAMISLRPITDANRDEVQALAVTPEQGRFVSGVPESIREAQEEPGAHAIYWAIYDEEMPVGFVMIADEVDDPDYIAHYLWKLFIDARYQRRGFGTATLDLIVEYFRNRGSAPCGRVRGRAKAVPSRSTSDTGSPRPEDPHGDEILLRLEELKRDETKSAVC